MTTRTRGRKAIYKHDHPYGTNLYGMYVSKDGYEYWKTYTKVKSALAVIPLTKNKKIVMIREYKVLMKEYVWQIPTGYIENNLSLLKNAEKELKEEAGYRARKFRHLFTFYPSMGSMVQRCEMVLAEDASYFRKPTPEKSEDIGQAKEFTVKDAVKMIEKGKIFHDSTIMGIYYLASKMKR